MISNIYNDNQTYAQKKTLFEVVGLINKYDTLQLEKSEQWYEIGVIMNVIDKVLLCSVLSIMIGMATSAYSQNYSFFWSLAVTFFIVIKVYDKFKLMNIVKNVFNEECLCKKIIIKDNKQESEIRKLVKFHLECKKSGTCIFNEIEKEIKKNT